MSIQLEDISIRTQLKPGDLGKIIKFHGSVYAEEQGFDVNFEAYVARGLLEFHENFNSSTDRIWICEHGEQMVGVLVLMNRGNGVAQLRFFLIQKDYRSIGLGKKLMDLYMEYFHQSEYLSGYLWTTHEQKAAINLYLRYGYHFSEERPSSAFGKPLIEKRYDFISALWDFPWSSTRCSVGQQW